MRTCYTGQVCRDHLGQTVTLFGWVHRRRDHGGVIFIDMRDRAGLAQIVFDPDNAEGFATAERLRNEFCIRVTGLVRERPAGTSNSDLASGEIEILCREVEILNPSVTPPFQLDDENLSETTRLTYRVLDLRRGQMQRNMMLRYRVSIEVRKFLDDLGFIDIETPMLTKSTPEGAPYCKASSKKPNLSCASSASIFKARNTLLCTSSRWIRTDPPPISQPFKTMS